MAPLFGRIYDCILDRRFAEWHTPNIEQAGFRKGEVVYCSYSRLLIHFSKKIKKDLIVGYLDYEKAFDYANRANIVLTLMSKGCGQTFTSAVAKMFKSTTYIPTTNNKICDEITTSYGVAQGRHSSPNFYSFYVSDMPRCTDELSDIDFMDPHNLAQLSDDSTIFASSIESFKNKMLCLLNYSRDIYQIPNISKTMFCHFEKEPLLDPIYITDDTTISIIDIDKCHRYLGMIFTPTNDFSKIININLNDRMGNISKFYAWLDINTDTPIEIKLPVLDSCLFSSMLYATRNMG